jgi:CDP-diglyceride synthetase
MMWFLLLIVLVIVCDAFELKGKKRKCKKCKGLC